MDACVNLNRSFRLGCFLGERPESILGKLTLPDVHECSHHWSAVSVQYGDPDLKRYSCLILCDI